MTAALLIFPVGFQSRVVRHYCHNTGMYHTGICELGWAYVLAIIGTALAMFLPYLSQYTDFRLNVVKRRPTYDDGKKVRIVGDKPVDKVPEPTPVWRKDEYYIGDVITSIMMNDVGGLQAAPRTIQY